MSAAKCPGMYGTTGKSIILPQYYFAPLAILTLMVKTADMLLLTFLFIGALQPCLLTYLLYLLIRNVFAPKIHRNAFVAGVPPPRTPLKQFP